jgi:branched-chain amino acid aminotransferase
MCLVYLNGDWYPRSEAKVSVYDHGFLYGDGIFETLRAYDGRIFMLDEHLNRLQRSAEAIRLVPPLTKGQLERVLYESLSRNGLSNARIRLTISRGVGELGLDVALCPQPTVVVMARAFEGCPADLYRRGMTAGIVATRRISAAALNPAIKSLNFLNNILAKLEAQARGADEALMLNQQGQLTEGTTSNLFWISGRTLKTPAVECGLLPGVTRRLVLELARRNEINITEGGFPPADLLCADEAFLTNTSLEIMPLVQVDGKPIGAGTPGETTRQLHELFKTEVREKIMDRSNQCQQLS